MRLVKALVIASLSLAAPVMAADAKLPQSITVVVPAPPGGANDTMGRIVAAKLQEAGHTVIVLNKPGGNLAIGAQFVANSPPDGKTLLVIGNAVAANPVLYPDMQFDALRDLQPVSRLADLEMMLAVTPSLPVDSAQALVAYSKQHPGVVNYGAGTATFEIAMERFKQITGASITRIPYNGTAKVVAAMLGGEVQATLSEATSLLPQVRAGKLKALAATPKVQAMPELEPLLKSAPGYDINVWLGLFAPKGTPPQIVELLNRSAVQAMHDPDVEQKLRGMGMVPVGGTADELTRTIVQDTQRIRAMVDSKAVRRPE